MQMDKRAAGVLGGSEIAEQLSKIQKMIPSVDDSSSSSASGSPSRRTARADMMLELLCSAQRVSMAADRNLAERKSQAAEDAAKIEGEAEQEE